MDFYSMRSYLVNSHFTDCSQPGTQFNSARNSQNSRSRLLAKYKQRPLSASKSALPLVAYKDQRPLTSLPKFRAINEVIFTQNSES